MFEMIMLLMLVGSVGVAQLIEWLEELSEAEVEVGALDFELGEDGTWSLSK